MFLPVKDILMASITNKNHFILTNQNALWNKVYKRDFNRCISETPSVSPKHMYYLRVMNCFMHADREKTINNMLYCFHT